MGCHTWTYKKVTALSEEEKAGFVNKELDFLENWWGFKKPVEDVIRTVEKWFETQSELFEDETKTPTEYALDMIKEYKDRLNNYKSKGFEAFLNEYGDKLSSVLIEYNGTLYVNIGVDTPCRVYCYSEKEFTDVDEFINWLKVTDNSFGYYSYECSEFIEGFTVGLEQQIRNYFKLNGEDDLLIKFG